MEAGLGESILNWEKIGNLKVDRVAGVGAAKMKVQQQELLI